MGQPKHSIQECRRANLTFEAPLKATLRLVRWSRAKVASAGSARRRRRRFYLGEIPLITERGTFRINGAEPRDREPAPPLTGRVLPGARAPERTTLLLRQVIPYRRDVGRDPDGHQGRDVHVAPTAVISSA